MQSIQKKVETMNDLPKDTISQSRHVPRLTSEFIWDGLGNLNIVQVASSFLAFKPGIKIKKDLTKKGSKRQYFFADPVEQLPIMKIALREAIPREKCSFF